MLLVVSSYLERIIELISGESAEQLMLLRLLRLIRLVRTFRMVRQAVLRAKGLGFWVSGLGFTVVGYRFGVVWVVRGAASSQSRIE